jgi:hypothetical protein
MDGSVQESADPWPAERRFNDGGAQITGAVIIPAHNEASVIARTLQNLAPLAESTGVEIIVVCNGCNDETAAIARSVPGVVVVEIDEASKTAALNVGDARASGWPRLYLDADIDVAPDAVLAVFDRLTGNGSFAARPVFVYDTSGASVPVRSYYRARSRIPAPATRLWGAGGYAVNQAGHRRFDAFPAVTADDSWIDTQFGDHEKSIVNTVPMRVRTPRDLNGLLAVLTRQRRGQVELGVPSSALGRGRALLASVRGPRSIVDMGWYVLLTALARRRSRAALRKQTRAWERDASTRRGSQVSS